MERNQITTTTRIKPDKQAENQSRTKAYTGNGQRYFTVAEYYKMAESGVLRADERVELLEGEILVMSPQGSLHSSVTWRVANVFRVLLGERAIVREHSPIQLDEISEPEPDVVIALPHEDGYEGHHPTTAETLLALEVSDSSLEIDRVRKKRIYAKAGIRQYCVLNLRAREIEEYRQPSAEGYRSKQTYRETESFTLAAFPDITVNVADLLPRELVKRRKRKAS